MHDDREEVEARAILRRQLEEAVERMRYTWGGAFETDRKDVLDAGAFLAELDRIFGDRQERVFAKPAVGQEVLAWVDDSWEKARYRGPAEGQGYCWDFDTWGLLDGEVEHWLPVPPPPAGDRP